MSERSGIEIDYCPQCRGVWLDRGELDKIIDRSATAPQPQSYQPEPPRNEQPQYGQQSYGQPRYEDDRRRPRKRESWLSDLFD